MKVSRGRLTAVSVALLTLVGLGGAYFFFRYRIAEEWYIHHLDSKDQYQKKGAAARLGEMRSLRAVPYLIQIQYASITVGEGSGTVMRSVNRVNDISFPPKVEAALKKIGTTAIPVLVQALESESWQQRCGAVMAVGLFGKEAEQVTVRVQGLAANDKDENVRREAAETLMRIRGIQPVQHIIRSSTLFQRPAVTRRPSGPLPKRCRAGADPISRTASWVVEVPEGEIPARSSYQEPPTNLPGGSCSRSILRIFFGHSSERTSSIAR
jgi:HEAT repeats